MEEMVRQFKANQGVFKKNVFIDDNFDRDI